MTKNINEQFNATLAETAKGFKEAEMTKQKNQRKKLQEDSRSSTRSAEEIRIRDISGGTGFAIGSGAQAVVSQTTGVTADEIATVFKALQQKVSTMPDGPDKSVAENAVKALEAEARKGEQASEGQVQKWINFLAETAPDVWEVVIDTLANPIKGVGTVFKKIASKAKSEQEAKKAKQPNK